MGGHGGLNILPQKRWNVYNYDNREKVRKDEEAAAREEQLKREQSRRRDAEFRLEQLRQARGHAAATPQSRPSPPSDSHHINLFDGLKDFSSLSGSGISSASASATAAGRDEENREGRRNPKIDDGLKRDSKRKREEVPAVVLPEDEKYRMGYGVAGKGVKAPWYLSRSAFSEGIDDSIDGRDSNGGRGGEMKKKKMALGKKTIEELREERVRREKLEKERERALLISARRDRRGL